MNAWGIILQKKAEVGLGWWIIGFPLVSPGPPFHWADVGRPTMLVQKGLTRLLERCAVHHYLLKARNGFIHSEFIQFSRCHARQGIPQGGTCGRNSGNTAGSGIKGQFWAVGTSPSASDSAQSCLSPALPSPALASSTGCYCARKRPGPSICDRANTVVMILKISSLKSTNCWEILFKKVSKLGRSEHTASDFFFFIILIASVRKPHSYGCNSSEHMV